MIYKLRKGINLDQLDIRWLIYNPHPGVVKIVEENFEDIEMEDFYRILQYPNFIHFMLTKLHIFSSPYLSKNSDAIYILMKHPELINWELFSTNSHPLAMEIIEQNIVYGKFTKGDIVIQCPRIYSSHSSYWKLLATNSNPKAVEIIEKYYTRLYSPDLDSEHIDFWRYLSKNPNAIHLLEKYLEKYPQNIYWDLIIQNPNAIHIIEKNLDKIHIDDWDCFAGNPNAIHIIEKYLHKINYWYYLSGNPNAMPILEKKLDMVDWQSFSENPSAIHIILQVLEQQNEVKKKRENDEPINPKDYKYYDHFDKIDFIYLSKNPAIFELDYQGLKERCDLYRKELMEKTMHPSRMIALLHHEGIELENLEGYF